MLMKRPTPAELDAETAAISRWLQHLVEHPHRPYKGKIFGR